LISIKPNNAVTIPHVNMTGRRAKTISGHIVASISKCTVMPAKISG